MAGYITTAEFIAYFPDANLVELFADMTIGGTEPTVVDPDIIDPIIESASRKADGYLRKHYAVPLSPCPPELKECVANLVLYAGFKRRAASSGGVVPLETRKAYSDDQIAWLEKVQSGTVDLGSQPQPQVNTSRGVDFTSEERAFTADSLKGV